MVYNTNIGINFQDSPLPAVANPPSLRFSGDPACRQAGTGDYLQRQIIKKAPRDVRGGAVNEFDTSLVQRAILKRAC